MNSKKQKMYVPPTVEVVQLKMRNQLLAGSQNRGVPQVKDYDVNNEVEE